MVKETKKGETGKRRGGKVSLGCESGTPRTEINIGTDGQKKYPVLNDLFGRYI